MNYIVLQRYDLNELEKIVNEKIEQGWIPLGGVSTSFDVNYGIMRGSLSYSQAMVKNNESTFERRII